MFGSSGRLYTALLCAFVLVLGSACQSEEAATGGFSSAAGDRDKGDSPNITTDSEPGKDGPGAGSGEQGGIMNPGQCQLTEADCNGGIVHPDCFCLEVCDGVDNDGDGEVDEGFDEDCDGYVSCLGDCNDDDAGINPGMPEICDGIDNNCTGVADEGLDLDGNGFADCFDVCPAAIDFDFDPAGNPIAPGTDLSEVYASMGVHFVVFNDVNMEITGTPLAFDSSNPTPGFEDLGTPNEAFGGPGIGDAGAITNDIARNNLLVSADTSATIPDTVPYSDLTWIWVFFERPTCINTFDLVDIDENEVPVSVPFFDADGNLIERMSVGATGDNGVATVDASLCGVSLMMIDLLGTGGIDNITFCPEGNDEVCDGLDNDGDNQVDEGFDNDGDGIADCFEEQCPVFDFDTDAAGNPIEPGQDLSEVYAPYGLHIIAFNDVNMEVRGLPLAFNSSAPSGGQLDMGTPNAQFGGPGVGDGGADNTINLNNVLVSADDDVDLNFDGLVDDPKSYEGGPTWIWFLFEQPVCINSLQLLDVDSNEVPVSIPFIDVNGNLIELVEVNEGGDNSVVTIRPNVCNVSLMMVDLLGTGGVDNLDICPGEIGEVCDGIDNDGDGEIDEGLLNACGTCGDAPIETCDGEDNDCDGEVDEGVLNACGGCGSIPDEICNEEDDDCDGEIDEGTTNACGTCGDAPMETCDGEDNDCDDEIDEGVTNACGECGPTPMETCDGEDNDCDGEIDEGVTNACGTCGDVPMETCDGEDNDCDGEVDEGVLNACGTCGDVPMEVCDGEDNDCDTEVDEGLLNACGTCGEAPVETCDGEDNDCDGEVDEGVLNACGECGPAPMETCDGEDNDCDDEIDEGVTNACGECGPAPMETCDDEDNDCDGEVDEGTLNACGTCGAAPMETCDGEDNDCDDEVDEGTLNACGECGPTPMETCDGEDNDCDGEVDEGTLNACGTCGATPLETCDDEDNDCDGEVDEGTLNACGECGLTDDEVCDGSDNDCDGEVDEGTLNACGTCGEEPTETCDGRDNDCDDEVDEGVLNTCGVCGQVPEEVCDGRDNDCDDEVDEDVLNACGVCGDTPAEACDGEDNDCDGEIDEGVNNECGSCGIVPDERCDGEDNDCDGEIDEGFDENNDGTADCLEADCFVIDFDTDADGNPIAPGEDTRDSYRPWGVRILLFDDASSNIPVPATTYDTTNPSDPDMGTPNEQFGGPGVGDGGATNDEALNNVLVVSDNFDDNDGDGLVDNPNPMDAPSWIKFYFDEPVCIVSFDLLDVEIDESPASIQFFDEMSNRLFRMRPGGLGNNSVETVHANVCGVTFLLIDLRGAGGVDNVRVCPPEAICDGAEFTQLVAEGVDNQAMVVNNFTNEGDRVIFSLQENARMTLNPDGTALLTGVAEVTDGGNAGEEWQVVFEYNLLGQGNEFGTPRVELPEIQTMALTDVWEYYELTAGQLMRRGVVVNVTEQPGGGLQVGEAANNRNSSFGASMAFVSTGQISGSGDINVSLEPLLECRLLD